MYIDISKLTCNVNKEGKGYLAYVDLGKDENGKRIRPKARGRSEDEAVQKLERKIREMGYIPQEEEAPKLDMLINQFSSIPDFVREYRVNGIVEDVQAGEIKSRSAENYVYMLNHFEKYFKAVTVGDITVKALNQFFREEEKKYAQSTLHKVEWIVHRVFNRAVENKWITYNPFTVAGYKAPKSKKVMEKIEGLTSEELAEFLGLIKQYPIIYNPIMLMLNTGMRTQEVLGLKWGDVDFQNNRLFIRRAVTMAVEFDENGKIKGRKSVIGDTKTEGSNREIGLTEEAKRMLLEWREEAPLVSMTKLSEDDFIFGYERKPNFTYCAFRDRVNDFLTRQAGNIDKMRLHRFRHTVGTLLAAEGREIVQIMRQLGITQEKTLQRYIDKKGNQKIITGNVDAISKGLTDMINSSVKNSVNSATVPSMQARIKDLTDSERATLIMALVGGA